MNKNFTHFILYLVLFNSCSVDKDEPIIEPIFSTTQLDTPTHNYNSLYAEIDEEQEDKIIDLIEDHGFAWSSVPNNSLENSLSQIIRLGLKKRNYAFRGFVGDLQGNTIYYVRAFIKMNDEIYYANEVSFKTKPGTWRKLKDFPGTNTVHATSFVLNNMAYVVCENEVWTYDPIDDEWTKKNNFPVETNGATGFNINDKGYIYCSNIWEYNLNSDSWTSLLTTSQPSYLAQGCQGVSSFVYGNKAYIAGGARHHSNGFTVFDPETNEYSSLDFSHQKPYVFYASCISNNGKAYMVGGKDWISSESQVLFYDIVNKSWDRKREFRNDRGYETARAEMVNFNINGDMYVGMGYGEFPLTYGTRIGSQNDFYRYDAINDYWEPQTYPVIIDDEENTNIIRRAAGVGFSINNKGYMGLGEYREYNRDTEEYETFPLIDFWEFTPN